MYYFSIFFATHVNIIEFLTIYRSLYIVDKEYNFNNLDYFKVLFFKIKYKYNTILYKKTLVMNEING